MSLSKVIASAAVTGGMLAGALGLGAAVASADPAPPPLPPAGPSPGSPPAWAPPKPVEPSWANGAQEVWDQGWQHWGVWMNGVFVPTY
ncbi:MAG TPA: hypothetical protein VFB19_08640 [Mycobacterium sp.]|nr:hypothetical protein [Mycobacterium sp.]